MNVVGRQMHRTSGGTTTNDFIEIPSKLIHYASLPKQYMVYGGESGGGGVNWNDKINNNINRNIQSLKTRGGGISSNLEFPLDPPSPPRNVSRVTSLQKADDSPSSPHEYSPGLLDTKFISEAPALGLYDGPSLSQLRVKSFDESEPHPAANRISTRANPVAKIKVVVRKRPLNKKEMSKKEDDIITTEPACNSLTVHETKLKVDLTEYVVSHEFVFNAVLDEHVSNDKVYTETVEPIVPLIFHKTKATCFAYGQTGSGKTYTMQPLPLRASRDILALMHHTYRNQGYQLFVSFFEIYGGKLFDANESKSPQVIGKLSFIDLAGSERGADTTDNDKQTRMEGAEINKSLLALKECIRALDNSQNHIPFRGSKLTEVLRDSFVGNSRTVMISCVSPNSGSCEHTLNTLRYADRVKSLSKGNNSKREVLSTTPKDSQTLSSSPTLTRRREARIAKSLSGRNRFGLSREFERETPPSPVIERVHSGRAENSDAFSDTDNCKGKKRGANDVALDDYNNSEEILEHKSLSWRKNNKAEIQHTMDGENRVRKNDFADFHADNGSLDEDLHALLQEEEELVAAHKSLVEDSIELVGEEMNMLIEADQPGNQLDDYISKLNSVLSQKAAGILKLQTRLANFKRRLNEHNVLVLTSEQ